MADELTAARAALEASDKARRQLLADVSHELMTPLTAMRGYIETLTMPELQLDAATRQRYLGIVTDETHRLERIIGDLLDLARLEGGGGDDAPRAVPTSRSCSIASPRGTSASCATRRITLVAARGRGGGDGRRRPRSSRAGAAEPRRQRAAPHAGRRRDRA